MSNAAKKCSACGEVKPRTEFVSRGGEKAHLLRSRCKPCTNDDQRKYQREYWHQARRNKPGVLEARAEHSRWFRRLKKYGVTEEAFYAHLMKQNGKCAICGIQQGMELRVDHDHSTGEVRALLCASCNSGLGLFKEDVVAMQKAIEYVKRHGKS